MKEKPKTENISGTVEHIIFTNPENGYAVIRIETGDGEPITVVGILGERRPGEYLKLEGFWKTDPRWGRQFKVENFELAEPETAGSLERYLASDMVPGIGSEMARRLVEHFGNKVMSIIREHPDRLREVPGIGPKRSKDIIAAVAGEDREKRILRELSTRLMDFGIGPARIRKIFLSYGDAALDILQRDPYRLAKEIGGFGFIIADKIARKMKIPADSESRIKAGILYALDRANDEGHCFLPQEELLDRAVDLLGVSRENTALALQSLCDSNVLQVDDSGVYNTRFFAAEVNVAERINAILTSRGSPLKKEIVIKKIAEQQKRMKIEFTSEQSAAVFKILCDKPVLALTGGPGTGKTTIVRAAAQIARDFDISVALCAPTGRAANRLSEATGLPACTVHRLLEYSPQNGFTRRATNPLRARFIVVDEMSMVDIALFSALLSAVRPGTRLLLVGDADQLPSVGPGQVLHDIINSGAIPVVRLTQIHRQAARSRIVREAHNILHGRMPILKNEPKADFFFLRKENPENGLETIVDLVSHRLPEHYNFDPKKDIQVIVPMYRGICGANALNEALQRKLNPGEKIEPFDFRPGDKVMQTRNNYDINVFNGDIGIITEINPEEKRMVVDFGFPIAYSPEDAGELTIAYAVSVHKSQGSEMPCVVMPLYTEHYMLLRRHLLYTAVTRAKKLCVLIGQPKALGIAVRRAADDKRYTDLAKKIRKLSKTYPKFPGFKG